MDFGKKKIVVRKLKVYDLLFIDSKVFVNCEFFKVKM